MSCRKDGRIYIWYGWLHFCAVRGMEMHQVYTPLTASPLKNWQTLTDIHMWITTGIEKTQDMCLNVSTDHVNSWVKHHVKTNVSVRALLTRSVKQYLQCLTCITDTVQVYFWIISLQAHTSTDHNSHLLCLLPTHCSITGRAASVQSVSKTASTSRER